MIEEIFPNLFQLEIPLPGNPLKAINSYVIKTEGNTLIIDTGMNREECMNAMQSGLKKIDVDLRKTNFFITHLHADHLGLVSSLAIDGSKIYFNKPDMDIINRQDFFERMNDFALLSGFPEDNLINAFKNHPGYKYKPSHLPKFTILKEGDILDIGDYKFTCIETPGHTRGHICLYETNKKIFISGDHILNDITPNISLWSDKENPLNEYIKSLDKIYELDIEYVLPGHRSIFRDCKGRINELKLHHERRNNEILSIFDSYKLDAFQIASKISWDLTYESFDLFPTTQKWFATGETNAHLKYLMEKGLIQKETQGKKILFSLQ